MPIDDACRFVASILDKENVPIRGRSSLPSWKTVKGWRYEVKRQKSCEQEAHTLSAFQAEARFPETMPLAELKAQVTEKLSTVVRRFQATLD